MSKRQPRESEIQEPSFQIRPSFEKKFRPGAVKDLIHTVLNDSLTGNYNHFLSISNSYVLYYSIIIRLLSRAIFDRPFQHVRALLFSALVSKIALYRSNIISTK